MAAGLGFKDFTTGEVLTAADVDGYLMQGVWVFANAAARTAAVTSPQEGNASFLKDTNALEIYDGAAWVAYGAGDITGVTAGTGISGGGTSGTVTITNSMATAIDAKGDLVVGTGADTFSRLAVGANGTVLTADSAEATGLKWAAASATSGLTKISTNTFTASSTVNINSIFSSTYKKYKLILQFTASVDDVDVTLRLRASSTDTTTNYKSLTNYYTGTADNVESLTTAFMGVRAAGSARNAAEIVLINPFESTTTNIISMAYGSGIPASNNGYGSNVRGIQTGTTSYDGISIIPGAGNITGTCTIYGFEE